MWEGVRTVCVVVVVEGGSQLSEPPLTRAAALVACLHVGHIAIHYIRHSYIYMFI